PAGSRQPRRFPRWWRACRVLLPNRHRGFARPPAKQFRAERNRHLSYRGRDKRLELVPFRKWGFRFPENADCRTKEAARNRLASVAFRGSAGPKRCPARRKSRENPRNEFGHDKRRGKLGRLAFALSMQPGREGHGQ